jgi:hypothetical protein
MKIAVRALVLGMLFTGFAATHMQATKSAPAASTSVASLSAAPMPGCQPGKSACGSDHW